MNPYTNAIIELQRRIFEQTGRRTDAHYKEYNGVLFVYEGEDLIVSNVILAVDEFQLAIMNAGEVTIL